MANCGFIHKLQFIISVVKRDMNYWTKQNIMDGGGLQP